MSTDVNENWPFLDQSYIYTEREETLEGKVVKLSEMSIVIAGGKSDQ